MSKSIMLIQLYSQGKIDLPCPNCNYLSDRKLCDCTEWDYINPSVW